MQVVDSLQAEVVLLNGSPIGNPIMRGMGGFDDLLSCTICLRRWLNKQDYCVYKPPMIETLVDLF